MSVLKESLRLLCWELTKGGKEESRESVVLILVRDDGDLFQGGSSGKGEKQKDSKYILKEEQRGFPDQMWGSQGCLQRFWHEKLEG